jgi:hypothetical protein
MKLLKNTTGSAISISDTGITVAASPGTYTIPQQDYLLWAASIDIVSHVNSGNIVVNDGVNDITVANGFNLINAIDYLKHPDTAFNIRFLAEPERMNGFVAKNVQEAVEEAKAAIEGKVSVLPTFLNNGLTKNKWLALDGAMNASNILPAVTAFDSKLAAITFINGNNNADTDLEFYKNGVLIYTWYIRNKRYAYKTGGLSAVTFLQGDRISCFAKETTDHNSQGGNGTGVDPTSVIIFVNVQTVNSLSGEGGGVTL